MIIVIKWLFNEYNMINLTNNDNITIDLSDNCIDINNNFKFI